MFSRLKNGYSCKVVNKNIIYKLGRIKTKKIILHKDDKQSLIGILESYGIKNQNKIVKISQNLVDFLVKLSTTKPVKALEVCPQCLLSVSKVSSSIFDKFALYQFNTSSAIDYLAFDLAASATAFESSGEFYKDKSLREVLQQKI